MTNGNSSVPFLSVVQQHYQSINQALDYEDHIKDLGVTFDENSLPDSVVMADTVNQFKYIQSTD